jgi:hypothetical protein
MLAMQPFWWCIFLPALGIVLKGLARGAPGNRMAGVGPRSYWIPMVASLGLPFVLTQVIAPAFDPVLPPPGLMPRSVDGGAYLVRAPGQAADVAVLWFGDSRGGRHHTLESCLRLREVSWQRSNGVLRRGDVWMTEFFLHAGELHPSYSSYLFSSLVPWSPTGVHLIFQGPVGAMDASYFAGESRRVADRIQGMMR